MNNEELLDVSISDLTVDLEERLSILKNNLALLNQFSSKLNLLKIQLLQKSYKDVDRNIKFLKEKYSESLTIYKQFHKTIEGRNNKLFLINSLRNKKRELSEFIRTHQSILGSLLTSADWQSPSYSHSIYPLSGTQEGKILGTINDYKRDVHLDEEDFENNFVKEYVDRRADQKIQALLTNSGMAAFTTILNFLLSEKKTEGTILIGKSVYFQYKQIISKSFYRSVIEISEVDTDRLIKTIFTRKPKVVYIDSLSNSIDIPVPDLKWIFESVVKSYKEEIYFIIDNTCLSKTCQPYKLIPHHCNNLHLIIFESLMKYVHLGLDKITAGIILSKGQDSSKIFEYRKHSGTNILDSSVYVIPRPNRLILSKRLDRFQRNAFFLATSLQEFVDNNENCPLKKIIYPGLSNHPSYPWSRKMSFQGSFVNLLFREEFDSISQHKKFIDQAIKEAKKRNVELVAGTSFGLDITRIYLTSLWTDFGRPFIRIAVGTEDMMMMGEIAHVIISTLSHFRSIVPSSVLRTINRTKKRTGLKYL